MVKKLSIVAALIMLFCFSSRSQDNNNRGFGCIISPPFKAAHGVTGHSGFAAALTPPYAFPLSAKDTCGKIIFFYEDINIALSAGPAYGFAHPSGLGITRRNTMCSVAGYIQSVFDFGTIPAGQYLRILIGRSRTVAFPADAAFKSTLAQAWPYFDSTRATTDTVNGFFHDFVMSGIDPVSRDSGYHGEIVFNFDSINVNYPKHSKGISDTSGRVEKANIYSGPGDVHSCEYDLYSTGLHFMGHVMGFMNWGGSNHYIGGKVFRSNLYLSARASPLASTTYNPFTGLSPLVGLPGGSYQFWANDRQAPGNYPMDALVEHLSEAPNPYKGNDRISPGDAWDYVMQYAFIEGVPKRAYLKGDLETFTGIGYQYKPSFAIDSSVKINNHIPWSSKMSYGYNTIIPSGSFMETVPADYTMTNNTGASITIHLQGDTSLKDADGDSISVFPGSLVNFRGCGSGGNNHNSLVLTNSNRTITYTPRTNFYGRAQFGFNLWDGKEKGAFVLYTLDVGKGNKSFVTKGSNMVQNGNLEEGEEVKISGIAENVNNSINQYAYWSNSRFGWNLCDGQAYPQPATVRNSYSECNYTPAFSYGKVEYTFPYPTPDSTIIFPDLAYKSKNPEPYLGSGNRYSNPGALYLLLDTLRNCKRYALEFDAARNFDLPADIDTITLGFTTKDLINHPGVAHLVQRYPPHPVKGLKYAEWTHYRIPLTYCSDTLSTVMYLNSHLEDQQRMLIDNISLIQLEDTAKLVANASDSVESKCMSRLYTDAPDMGCPMAYTWKTLDGATAGTGASILVSTIAATTYIVTVTNGCGDTAKDTITVAACPCSVGAVFGATKDSVLSGTVSTSLSPGFYHVTGDLAITGTQTFTGANILIEPGVKITVANNAKLTLDSCHLLTCPDTNKLWKGIVLQSGTNSGKIEVRNNTLVEDAETAIDAVDPNTTIMGNIIDIQNSVFNRNLVAVHIENYTAGAGSAEYPFHFRSSVYTSRQLDKAGSGYPNIWPTAASLKADEDNAIYAPYHIELAYDKVMAKDSSWIEAGIKLNRVGATTGGAYYGIVIGGTDGTTPPEHDAAANLFDHTCTGVNAENVNLTCFNNVFLNMRRPDGPLPMGGLPITYYWGRGVIARGNNSDQRLLIKALPAINGSPVNKFFDCKTGVGAIGFYETEISSCIMTSSQTSANEKAETGISLTCGYFKDARISYNRISNITAGIAAYATNYQAGGSFEISHNQLGAVNPDLPSGASSAGQGMYYPISLQSQITPAGAGDKPAYIKDNVITGAKNGIEVQNLKIMKAMVQNNNIAMDSWTGTQHGIRIADCNAAELVNNSVYTPSLGINDYMRGVYVVFSTNTRVCGNSSTNINRGFDFNLWRAQFGTQCIGNTMDNNFKGFVLGSDIGDQGRMLDPWTGTLSYAATLNKWMGAWGGGKWETFVENGRNTSLSKLHVRTGMMPNELPIWNTSFPLAPFPQIYDLAGSLVIKTFEANCSGTIDHTPMPHSFGAFGGLILADALGYDNSYRRLQWMAQLSLYQMGRYDSGWRDSSVALDGFMTAAAGSRFEWLTDIENALAGENIGLAQSLLAAPPAALGKVVINNNIVLSDYTEADGVVDNYVDFYRIYIRYLQESLSGSDTAELELLAGKCPAIDGAVVFNARSLYSLVSGSIRTYEDDSCVYTRGGFYRTAPADALISGGNEYTLYPNPNNGQFALRRSIPSDDWVELSLYNSLGMQIGREKVQFTAGMANFRLQNPIPGLYLVCIREGQHKTTCIKFTVL